MRLLSAHVFELAAYGHRSHLFFLVECLLEFDERLVLPEELRVSDGLLGGLQQLPRRHGRKLRDLVLGEELRGCEEIQEG